VHVAYVRGSVLFRHVYDRPHRLSAGRGDGTAQRGRSVIYDCLVFDFSFFVFWAHQHKAAGLKIKLSIIEMVATDGVSFDDHSVVEGDRISPLKSDGVDLHYSFCCFFLAPSARLN